MAVRLHIRAASWLCPAAARGYSCGRRMHSKEHSLTSPWISRHQTSCCSVFPAYAQRTAVFYRCCVHGVGGTVHVQCGAKLWSVPTGTPFAAPRLLRQRTHWQHGTCERAVLSHTFCKQAFSGFLADPCERTRVTRSSGEAGA
ncbi:hypothetical protein TRVL_10311 [Trypanosoma vivax]|nr:hypothetical protein TRVL_10311 [Trypanosoma vivax]